MRLFLFFFCSAAPCLHFHLSSALTPLGVSRRRRRRGLVCCTAVRPPPPPLLRLPSSLLRLCALAAADASAAPSPVPSAPLRRHHPAHPCCSSRPHLRPPPSPPLLLPRRRALEQSRNQGGWSCSVGLCSLSIGSNCVTLNLQCICMYFYSSRHVTSFSTGHVICGGVCSSPSGESHLCIHCSLDLAFWLLICCFWFRETPNCTSFSLFLAFCTILLLQSH